MHTGHGDGDHSHCDADTCFAAKMRYLREGGNPALFQYKYGKERFHGPTIRERQGREFDLAAKQGRDIRLKHPVYDKKGAAS